MSPQALSWNDYLTSYLAWQLPILAVFGVGVLFAVRRWRQHRRVSILVILGAWFLLPITVIALLLPFGVDPFHILWTEPAQEAIERFRRMELVFTVTQAAGIACLITAVFMDRRLPADRAAAQNPIERRPD